jgi:hypothetical protein
MRRRFLLAGSAALVALPALLTGCFSGRSTLEIEPVDAGSDAPPVVDAGVPPIERSGKLDLLLVVDNSPNTQAFHEILASTVPYLMGRLTSPACVNGLGNVVATTPLPTDPCPTGEREFAPLADFHVAMISTSLGGHGADTCSMLSPSFNPAQDDAAHLLTREAGGGVVPSYLDKGFLAWDPKQALSPPGESDATALTAKVVDLVNGAGSAGCGFEAQLESMYRFLVDPEPSLSLPVINGKAVPTGTDSALLQQRADFVRPDSALLVVLVTDENDCSTREGGQFFLSNQGGDPTTPGKAFHLPRARSECQANPGSACCASCGQQTPPGCPPSSADASCNLPPADGTVDPINLRCFDQKRRFGIDFLYPVERYVNGFTETTIVTRDGSMVPNPLFAGNRSPKLVMLTGIVGVPWQDLATEPKALATGYKPASKIDWNLLLGDPATGTPPGDPLMIESIAPRTGVSPVLGDALAPPASGPFANPINGHERDIPLGDDLQDACIYPRATPMDCAMAACDCAPPDIDTNPVCQAADGSYSSKQGFARALPGLRQLRVLKGLGDQAAVASVCAAQTTGGSQPTFGYKPAVDAALRLLRSRLE